MKKMILITIVIILIPYLVVSIFIKEKEIEFKLVNSQTIRVMRNETGKVDVLPFEEYIVGVVAGEMPVSFHIEALKAQAVAARNYAYKKIEVNKENNYDVIDTTANQVYKDIEQLKTSWKNKYIENINKIRLAVNETIGEYLVYNNEIISLFYFSTSNGKTEDAITVFNVDLPYLKSVESPWDEKENSNFKSIQSFNLNEFCEILTIECNEKLKIENIIRDDSNRITSIAINNKTFKGTEIYKLLKLRSTDFNIEQVDNIVYFYTKGYGHGVGMSQYGANGMAKTGYSYDKILTHYYKGTTLKKF